MRDFKQYFPAGLILIVGLSISFSLYGYLVESEKRIAVENFNRAATERINKIQDKIKNKLTVIKSMVAFYNGSSYVSNKEFHTFINHISKNGESIHALKWLPAISTDKRRDYVDSIQKAGFPSFRIIEKNKQGKNIIAGKREVYYPVYYVVPYEGNEGAHGFDLGTNPIRLAALNKARDSTKVIATGLIKLAQLKEKNEGVLVFSPIYTKKLTSNSIDERRQNLQGFILAVFRLSNLVSGVFATPKNTLMVKAAGIDIYLYDGSDKDKLLYVHHSRARAKETARLLTLEQARNGINVSHSFVVGGRTWTLVLKPISTLLSKSSSGLTILLLVISILMTLLATFYFISIARRTKLIEIEVEQRTRELNEAVEISSDKEKRIRAIVDNSGDGIITLSEDGVISTVNPAFENIFGYSQEEVVGEVFNKFLPDVDNINNKLIKNIFFEKFKHTSETHDVSSLRKNGDDILLELTLSSVIIAAKKMFIIIIHDVTERKETEKLKEGFISTVSHELRTPMTSIKGSISLLLSGSVCEIPDAGKTMLNVAYNNSERLIRLINDILDVDKMLSGKMTYTMESQDLLVLLKNSIESNLGYTEKKGINLILKTDLPHANVIADSDRLMQVVTNLLSNAAKFSTEGADIIVGLEHDNNQFRVSVADTGKGIPEKFRDKIFERFSQVDSSDSKQIYGTGLGLAISQSIIVEHNGYIGYDSIEGEGTTFYFYIPEAK
ncbi:MAG: CHASE domain-containing protein [Gammaproteobacteria bacterium]|nr:CHASE domain-containing protein [Gammaproteobacteria bacterium]